MGRTMIAAMMARYFLSSAAFSFTVFFRLAFAIENIAKWKKRVTP